MSADIVVTSAAWERSRVDWPDPAARHDDPDVVCGELMRAVDWAGAVARRAWVGSRQKGVDPSRVGCTVGTLYGNDYVSEYVAGVVGTRGPRWLNPEAFAFAAPHATTAAICIELGVGGAALTLVGPTSGLSAVASGAISLTLNQHDVMLCGVYDWPSPFACRLYCALGVPHAGGSRGAAFLVLESRDHAASRGARPLGHVLGWAAGTPGPATGGDLATVTRTMRRAMRRAGLAGEATWSLLDVREDPHDRLRDVEEEARRAISPAAEWIAPPEHDPSTVVGPVLSLAAVLMAPSRPPSQRPTVVNALAPTGPYASLVYRRR